MTKEFIPYDLALELKELGFDEPCFTYYKNDQLSDILELVKNSEMENVNNEVDNYISAPTFSQAFRFFREKYNTLVTLYSNASGYLFEWHDAIGGTHRGWSEYEGPNDSGVWDTYQEAEIAAIVKLIEIIKNK